MTELEYLSARIYALASQLHFYAGRTHPYYDCACKEFYYIVNEIAKRNSKYVGVKVARSIKYRLNKETDEVKKAKIVVARISPAQAYRMAQVAIVCNLELMTAIQLEP